MKKRTVSVDDAVGLVLPHDLTRIVPGRFKGAAFRKGHRIRRTDIPRLRQLGKERIYLLELGPDELHEDDAAARFRRLAGPGISTRGPVEGKLTFFAARDGLLLVAPRIVNRINAIPGIVFATRHTGIPVRRGAELAGIRIVPLALAKTRIERAVRLARREPPLRVVPFRKLKVGLIVTGNEVAGGLIRDRFRPVIAKKLARYGSRLTRFVILPDRRERISAALRDFAAVCDLVILTGGMSVDPDDVTRAAIRAAGATIVAYGAPVLPGNMFLVARYRGKPILGVPACGMYHKVTVLDLFLPYFLAGLPVTKTDLIRRGYGGYCTHCHPCRWPDCPFGK